MGSPRLAQAGAVGRRPRLARSTGSAPAGSRVFVDQAVEDGSSADPFGVEAGHGGAGSVQFVGHALRYAPVRPGRAVVHLVFDQNGAKV